MYIDVEDYILQHEPHLQNALYRSRKLIISAGPFMKESIKYRVPFYYYNGPLCYLNVQKGKVYVGIANGHLLADEYGLLQGDGKYVRKLFVSDTEPVDEVILELIHQAMILNEKPLHSRD